MNSSSPEVLLPTNLSGFILHLVYEFDGFVVFNRRIGLAFIDPHDKGTGTYS